MNTNMVILEKTTKGYSAYVADLQGCIATGESIGEIKARMREAVEFHLEGMLKEGIPLPEAYQSEFVLNYKMDVPSLFEWFSGVLTKSAVSKLTGMNPSLISQYVNGMKIPSPKQTKKIELALHKLGRELLEIEL